VLKQLVVPFRSLKVRNYRFFLGGQLIKLTGVWTQLIAQDWLVLKLSGDSATALSTVIALQFLPMLLLSLYAGKLADRYDKRILLIVINGCFTVSTCVLGILVATGVIQLWQVFVFAGLTGVANAMEMPIRQAFVSELVTADLLPNALSLQAASFNAARIIGPAAGGVAISLVGLGPVFLAGAVLCAAPTAMLVQLRPGELYRTPRDPAAKVDSGTLDGLRYVRDRPDLVLSILLVFLVSVFGLNFELTLPLLAKTVFHTDASTFGLFGTALAVGALAGAFASGSRRSRPPAVMVLTSAAGFGALEIVVALAPTFLTVAALLVPTGFLLVFFLQAANQRIQLGTEPRYRGRVMALYVLFFLGTTPFGAMLIGQLVQWYGPRFGLGAGGAAALLAALVLSGWQVRRVHARIRVHLRPWPHFHVRYGGLDSLASSARSH